MDKDDYQNSPDKSTPPQVDRLKLLYPNVNEDETPLPRNWSPTDKCNSIYVHNYRVHYKGIFGFILSFLSLLIIVFVCQLLCMGAAILFMNTQ